MCQAQTAATVALSSPVRSANCMRLPTFFLLSTLLLPVADAVACRQLVKYHEHLTGITVDWFKDYRLATIVEAHPDRLVVDIKRRFDASVASPAPTTLYFIPDEEAHAVCPTQFQLGETYLIHVSRGGGREQISRFSGYNIAKDHPKYPGYVRDLERASAEGQGA
jgi:hypothetical protein